jgi:hypothetical protein
LCGAANASEIGGSRRGVNGLSPNYLRRLEVRSVRLEVNCAMARVDRRCWWWTLPQAGSAAPVDRRDEGGRIKRQAGNVPWHCTLTMIPSTGRGGGAWSVYRRCCSRRLVLISAPVPPDPVSIPGTRRIPRRTCRHSISSVTPAAVSGASLSHRNGLPGAVMFRQTLNCSVTVLAAAGLAMKGLAMKGLAMKGLATTGESRP